MKAQLHELGTNIGYFTGNEKIDLKPRYSYFLPSSCSVLAYSVG